MNEQHATVLLLLSQASDPEAFHTRKDNLLRGCDFADRALRQLLAKGWVENQKLGLRALGWRLTDAGREQLETAQQISEQAQQERRAQWEAQHLVYGTDRQGKPPLTQQQQRAWMRGFLQAQLNQIRLPDDAPAEVRENYPELVAWMKRHLAPYRPDGV